MSIHVHLERFEGPLGLLLHLIREQEMDVFNINIHQITGQYLDYIRSMRKLDLEVAGEFVAMAATLLHIKSRMLLPQYDEDGEPIVEDPRKELVQKLVEYKKIQELGADLYKLPLLGRDVLGRGDTGELETEQPESELVLEDNPMFSLISAYRQALRNMKKTVHRVFGELQSIAARIMEMKELLVVGRPMQFQQLITENGPRNHQVLVTFLSLLELAKMGFVSLFQSDPLSPIHIEPKRAIDRDIVSQVENYDSVHSEEKANQLMSQVNTDVQLSLEENRQADDDDDLTSEAASSDSLLGLESAAAEQPLPPDAATDLEIEEEERRLFQASEPSADGEL